MNCDATLTCGDASTIDAMARLTRHGKYREPAASASMVRKRTAESLVENGVARIEKGLPCGKFNST